MEKDGKMDFLAMWLNRRTMWIKKWVFHEEVALFAAVIKMIEDS
jgi:hypothetical protein